MELTLSPSSRGWDTPVQSVSCPCAVWGRGAGARTQLSPHATPIRRPVGSPASASGSHSPFPASAPSSRPFTPSLCCLCCPVHPGFALLGGHTVPLLTFEDIFKLGSRLLGLWVLPLLLL